MNDSKFFLLCGIAFAATSVALGAFGAHALKSVLPPQAIATWQTGVQYQMFHALGLLALGLIQSTHQNSLIKAGGYCMVVGVVLFSGSLYALSTTGIALFGPITPIGGVLLLLGWLLFFIGCWRGESR